MIYEFSGFTIDTSRRILMREDQPVAVEPQVFDVLRLLLENAGQVVSKDRLIEEVWGGRLVSEASISSRINAARAAVGDSGKDQAVIRTVSRRGFEFVAAANKADTRHAAANTIARQSIRFTTSADGTMIAYAISGDGPPVVIADRIATHLEIDWQSPLRRPYIDALSDGCCLVRYDARGTGLSEARPKNLGIAQHVNDLVAVIEAAGVAPCAIIGHMSGGSIALRLAAERPELVTKLALLNGYCDGRVARAMSLEELATDSFLDVFRSAWEQGGGGFERSAMSLFCPDATRDEIDGLFVLLSSCLDAEQVVTLRADIDRFSARDVLEKVKAPTRVVFSRKNGFHPFTEATKIASAVKNAELFAIDSANSMLLPSDPTSLEQVDLVRSFVASS